MNRYLALFLLIIGLVGTNLSNQKVFGAFPKARVSEGGTGVSSFNYGIIGSTGGTSALSTFATSSLGLLTTDVTEGSNLYYTDARVASYITGSTTLPSFLNYWTKTGSTLSYTGGNVGIGTSSPYARLSVAGQTVSEYFTATSTTATSVFNGTISTGSTTISSASGALSSTYSPLFVQYNGSSASGWPIVRIDNNATSGATPGLRIDIASGNTGAGTDVRSESTNTAYYSRHTGNGLDLDFDHDITNANWTSGGFRIIGTSVVNDAATYTKTGAIVSLTSNVSETSGSITDSAIVLDVNQTHADATGNLVDAENDGTGTALKVIQDGVPAANQGGIDVRVNGDMTNAGSYGMRVYSNTAFTSVNQPLVRFDSDNASAVNPLLRLQQDGSGTALFADCNGNGRCADLDHDGNSASAITGLHINVANAGAGAAYAAIFEAGNVGIGLTAPATKLDVSGTIRSYGTSGTPSAYLGSTDGSTGSGLEMLYDFSNTLSRITSITRGTSYRDLLVDVNNLRINTGAGSVTEAMRVTSDGKIGIGTSTPYAKLSVVGQAVAEYFTATSTTATSLFSGNVTVTGTTDLSASTVKQHTYSSFSYATSTAWTGTTTIPLGPAYTAESWSGIKCFTDTGTLNVSLYDGTNRMDMFNASTTVGTVTLSTNNTFTAAEKRYVDIGTPASTPTKVSCTVDKVVNN